MTDWKVMKRILDSMSPMALLVVVAVSVAGCPGCGTGDSAERKALAALEEKSAVQASINSEQQVVSLKSASLLDADATTLREYPKLQKLVLSGSRVGKSLTVLSDLTQLRELELENTDITDVEMKSLAALSNLQVLNLAGCNITDEGLQHLKTLIDLQSLNLNRTKIRGAGLASITSLSKLETLSLQETELQASEIPSLAGLSRLRILHLAKTPVDGAFIPLLADLPNLERLYLDETKISDDDIPRLAAVLAERTPQLKGLFFDDTSLSDASIDSFIGFSKLKSLALIHLGGTRISLEGYIKLRQTLPEVNFVSQH
jgi:Leucine-rich repeat (LRR) protein